MDESSAPLKLPSLAERLPELIQVINQTLLGLQQAKRPAILAFEPLYEKLHSLKGLTKILSCEAALEKFIVQFCHILAEACVGQIVAAENAKILEALVEIRQKQNAESVALLAQAFQKAKLAPNPPPFPMPYPDARVSFRYSQAQSFGYKIFSLEQSVLLSGIPAWREKLLGLLKEQSEDCAILIHAIPFVYAEASRSVRYWACFGIPSNVGVEQALRSNFPEAKLIDLTN